MSEPLGTPISLDYDPTLTLKPTHHTTLLLTGYCPTGDGGEWTLDFTPSPPPLNNKPGGGNTTNGGSQQSQAAMMLANANNQGGDYKCNFFSAGHVLKECGGGIKLGPKLMQQPKQQSQQQPQPQPQQQRSSMTGGSNSSGVNDFINSNNISSINNNNNNYNSHNYNHSLSHRPPGEDDEATGGSTHTHTTVWQVILLSSFLSSSPLHSTPFPSPSLVTITIPYYPPPPPMPPRAQTMPICRTDK